MNQNDASIEPSTPDAQEEGVSLLDLLLAMKEAWRLMVLVPLVLGSVALAVAFLIKPSYTATTQMMTPQQQSGAASLLDLPGGLASALSGGGMKSSSEQWVGLLKSRTIADALIAKFDLTKVYNTEYRFQAVDQLASSTRVSAGKDGMITVEVSDHDPARAAAIANGYVERLQALSNTLAVSEAAQRRLFFEKQLVEARDALTKAQIALSEAGVGLGALKTSPEVSVGEVATLRARVAAQEVRLSVMRGTLTPANAQYRQAARELDSLKEQLQKAAQQDPGAGVGAGSGAEYITRYRNFKYAESMFEMMARQYELARVDEAKEGALVQVVDPAQVPEWKSKPKRGMIAATAALLGFLLAGLYVFLHLLYRTSDNEQVKLKVRRLVGRAG